MQDIKKNIEKLNNMITEVTECLYQYKEKQGFDQFELMFPLLTNISDTIASIAQSEPNLSQLMDQFNKSLISILNSLESKDTVMVADILNFELREIISNISLAL